MFKIAQTFSVDQAAVRNAEHVILTSIDLYFKKKPQHTNNKSNIFQPGVILKIVETKEDGVPDVGAPLAGGVARLEYTEILASSTGALKSNFRFATPVICKSGKTYAILISYDGDEDYELWTVREGEVLVGTNTRTAGATAKYVGNYYEYTSVCGVNPSISDARVVKPDYTSAVWKPLKNVDLKFAVYIGAYAAVTSNATPATNLVANCIITGANKYEFITFDRYDSNTLSITSATPGEYVYQETPVSYGYIRVNSKSLTVQAVSDSVNFNTLYSSDSLNKNFVILRDSATTNIDVREVVDIFSNSEILLDARPSFTTNTATLSVSPVGKLNILKKHRYHGRWWDAGANTSTYHAGRDTPMIVLTESNANSSVRFVNNMITGISIVAGGDGYANTDSIRIYTTGITGSLNAAANVVTNSTGGITAVTLSNAGFGFTNTISYTILNANTVSSAGTGATINVTSGSTMRTELTNAYFSNCVIINLETHRSFPHMHTHQNQHHTVNWHTHQPFYVIAGTENTLLLCNVAQRKAITQFWHTDHHDKKYKDGRIWVMPSRSNEVLLGAATLNSSANVTVTANCGMAIEANITSNNIFSVPIIVTPDIYVYNYAINNDYTNEHKNTGNAVAKHISTKVSFENGYTAEDLLVYVRAHRPANTSIKVYARIHNSQDSEAFDDKDYTLLECTSNNETDYSALGDSSDIIEYTYTFGQSPNTYLVTNGTSLTVLSNTEIVGTDTAYNTELAVNDVVKVYDPLFPNNYMITTVNSITNSTHLVITTAVSNNDIVGYGRKIDLLGRPANTTSAEVGWPQQAYNDILNDNVVRYFASSVTPFDGYNTFSVKVVLLSDNRTNVPMIEDIRAIGVTA